MVGHRGLSVLQKCLVHERGEPGANWVGFARCDDFLFSLLLGWVRPFSSDASYRSDWLLSIELYCRVVVFDC